jgi:drug/metabolite transporter (DMT)-like permease
MWVTSDISLAFLIAVIWGIYPFVVKNIMKDASVHIALLGLTFASLVSAITYNIYRYGASATFKDVAALKYSTVILIALSAFVFIFFKNQLYFHVIDQTSRLNVTIALMSLSSVVSLIIGLALYKYDLNIGTIVGVTITGLGVFVLLLSQTQNGSMVLTL